MTKINRQIGGWRQYTHSATTAAWLAQHFYWHFKFSADPAFLRDRAWPYLHDASVFIEAVTAPCREGGAVSKVIIEAALLTDDEKIAACTLAKAAGADFVKTSTGFGPGGATAADVALMRKALVDKIREQRADFDMSYVMKQRGMFSYSGLTKAQVDQLREKYSIYAIDTGRICVSALNSKNIDFVVDSVAKVIA